MSVPGFNSHKCEQRNRIAAAKYGVNAVPLRFRGSSPAQLGSDGFTVLAQEGDLPGDRTACLSLINALQPEGAEPLGDEDVLIHFLEAANSNFVGDRFLFIGDSTLQNIATGGADGVSFMNSHRTGGLSEPAELPFGQSFCGSYEQGIDQSGNPQQRATVGVFMLRDLHPTGANGPSTDELDRMMRGGMVKDVSVGLLGGEQVCDICGHGLFERGQDAEGYSVYLCPHVPGTHRAMTQEQIDAQVQRDARNASGYATYTLHDARLLEVSAVYDGAVPGAGVKKALSVARSVSGEELQTLMREAFAAYGSLLPFDLNSAEIDEFEIPTRGLQSPRPKGANMNLLQQIAAKLGIEDSQAHDSPPPPAPVFAQPSRLASVETELAQKNAQLAQAQEREDARRREDETRRETELSQARADFATSLNGKVAPSARAALQALFAASQNGGATQAHVEAFVGALPTHPALQSVADAEPLAEVEPPKADDPHTREEAAAKAFAQKRNEQTRKTRKR